MEAKSKYRKDVLSRSIKRLVRDPVISKRVIISKGRTDFEFVN